MEMVAVSSSWSCETEGPAAKSSPSSVRDGEELQVGGPQVACRVVKLGGCGASV